MTNNPNSIDVYCDGGARGNPGPAACAFAVKNKEGQVIFSEGMYMGTSTNNLAEYQAVLNSLIWLTQKYSGITNLQSVDYYLDSLLVVSQINGVYKVKDIKLKEIHHKILLKIIEFKHIKFNFNYIPRSKNYSADLLVNETLDKVM